MSQEKKSQDDVLMKPALQTKTQLSKFIAGNLLMQFALSSIAVSTFERLDEKHIDDFSRHYQIEATGDKKEKILSILRAFPSLENLRELLCVLKIPNQIETAKKQVEESLKTKKDITKFVRNFAAPDTAIQAFLLLHEHTPSESDAKEASSLLDCVIALVTQKNLVSARFVSMDALFCGRVSSQLLIRRKVVHDFLVLP